MATQVSLNDGAVASAGALAIQTNGTTQAVSISTGQVATLAKDAVIQGVTVGRGAGAVSTNTAVGASALAANGAGSANTAVGAQAGTGVTTGSSNSLVGQGSGTNLTTGSSNTIIGAGAGYGFGGTNTASNNTLVGLNSGFRITTGGNNIAIGVSALEANTTASNNTAVGYQSLYTNTTSANNTAIGNLSGRTYAGTGSSFVGAEAGYSATTGNYLTVVGYQALNNAAVTGSNIEAFGYRALFNNTSGANNVAVGSQALQANTTASNNTAVGYQALYTNQSGASNVAMGYQAGYSCTSAENVFIGYQAGQYTTATTTGNSNIFIGPYCRGSGATVSGELVIGYNLAGKGVQTAFIGGSTGAYNAGNSTTWLTTSDRRLKKNIVDNNTGLDKITAIQVRDFEYRSPEEVDAELKPTDAIAKSGVQLGVIAQELQQVLPECVKTESTGVMSVNADNLTWYMVNAIKELKAEIDNLKSQLNQGA